MNLPYKEGAVATTAAGEQIALDDLEPLDALRAYRALPQTEKNQIALSLEDYRGLRPRGEIRDDPDRLDALVGSLWARRHQRHHGREHQ